MTASGRPGRDDQDNLVTLAANGLGVSYADLLAQLVESAHTLEELRGMRPISLEQSK